MTDNAQHEDSISIKEVGESLELTVEINIKTLDSHVYKFRISKDMSVPTLKLKVAEVTGTPVEQQRLIFKGKVLKDDHLISAYHLEDGDTLHLVARQPAQAQPLPGSGSADSSRGSSNQGNDSTSNTSRNRVTQISQGVVLGPVNIADQGEDLISNIGRVVGAVLQSLGGGISPPGVNNIASAGSGNQGQPAVNVVNLNQPFQVPQLAPTGTVPRTMFVPDSLTTLLDFIDRMESILQNAGFQSSAPHNTQDPTRSQISSSQLGRLPTPDLLASAIEHARQLLCGNVAAAFSRIVEHLRQEASYSDATIQSQIQSEAMHMGMVMHSIGAMLLELGRTTTMLRMGSSHGESFVNSGPAVYISSTGPNAIMVQPSIPQASPLSIMSSSMLGGLSAPFGGVDLLRNLNIHVLSGGSLANGATSGVPNSSTDGSHGQPGNIGQPSGPSQNRNDSSATSGQGVPIRSVVAAIPARHTTETANRVQNAIYPVHARPQQTSTEHSAPSQGSVYDTSGIESNLMTVPNISSALASNPEITQINSSTSIALSGAVSNSSPASNLQQGFPTMGTSSPFDVSVPFTQKLSAGGTSIENVLPTSNQSQSSSFLNMLSSLQDAPVSNNDIKNVLKSQCLDSHLQDGKAEQVLEEGNDFPPNADSVRSLDLEASSSNNIFSSNTVSQSTDESSEKNSKHSGTYEGSSLSLDDERPPLGLGLGGLQPKKRSKSTKSAMKDGTSHVTSAANQNHESFSSGQQILQSLASQTSGTRNDPIGSSRPFPSSIGQIMNDLPLGHDGGMAQLDLGNMMSQVLQNSSVNNLLTNLAEQTGMGSLSDFSENGHARLGQNLGSMLSGSGRGQGGLDISRIFQQMMPVVAQAIDSISTQSSGSAIGPEFHQRNMSGVTSPEQGRHRGGVEIDLHEVRERIERHDIPRDIFSALLESTEQLHGDNSADLVQELGNDVELGEEYEEMLRSHIEERLDNQPEHSKES